MIVSAFHPELRHGGSQRVAYDLFRELQRSPHGDPVFLAAVDDQQSRIFPSAVPITAFEGRAREFIFRSEAYDPVWQKLCSSAAIEALWEFFSFHQPDIVHFHHYVFFGIDILSLVRGILPDAKIVLTLHDFAAICPVNGCMVRTVDGSLCDSATSVRCHQCIPGRQPNHFETRRLWLQRHLANVDLFVSPSRFLLERHVEWGIAREKMVVVANGVAAPKPIAASAERVRNRFGFFGQLIDMKGVHLILRAVGLLRAQGFTDFTVEINGDNLAAASAALRREYETFMSDESARPRGAQIVFENGPYEIDQIEHRMARLDWCLCPSIWWETFALVISEAWSFGKPVICSDVGAMAERVVHDRNGLLFTTNDAEALAASIKRAVQEPDLWHRLAASLPPVETTLGMAISYNRFYRDLVTPITASVATPALDDVSSSC